MPEPTTRDLEAITRERGGQAYIITVSEQGAPHAVYVPVRWDRGAVVAEVGAGTAANAATRPQVSLLYPVRAPGDYSLIVDGQATMEVGEGRRVRVKPTRIVLHRPGPPLDPASACGADCVPIAVPLSISRG